MPAPPFGTASAYTDSFPAPPPKQVTVTAETCYNLGVFRDIVRQYRKLDDQIIIRLNRAQAELRDHARTSTGSSWIGGGVKSMDGAEGMCVKMWSEMMGMSSPWCSSFQTVQSSVEGKRNEGGHVRGIKEGEVLADQLASEESIEAIIRKRTLEAFKSRCPFFTPSDTTSKAWFNLADRGLKGHGPDLP
ncbi:hypothetical protein LQV05_003768 [Cryptococcus neoformans]|nr:hypothetical protein LQV05_003768 [Cryptococcus neoformans]